MALGLFASATLQQITRANQLRKPQASHRRDAMTAQQPTAADVERLQHALKRERTEHREAKRVIIRLERQLFERVEALEQRQPAGPDLGQITGALAGIRADLRAELAALRGELTEVADTVHAFTRQP